MYYNENEALFFKRIKEKADKAFYSEHPTYTDFLDLHEQSLLLNQMKSLQPICSSLFGGNEACERKVGFFYKENCDFESFNMPITALLINPHSNVRLTHRDYLGAIMNIGIERSKIGDIVCKENGTYVFCFDQLSYFIKDELRMVKTTYVDIEIVELSTVKEIAPNFEIIKGTVSSIRLDNIVKLGFYMSRGNATALIQGGKTFVNHKITDKSSANVLEGSVISVRGFGKIKVNAILDVSKKGRIFVELYKYK